MNAAPPVDAEKDAFFGNLSGAREKNHISTMGDAGGSARDTYGDQQCFIF